MTKRQEGHLTLTTYCSWTIAESWSGSAHEHGLPDWNSFSSLHKAVEPVFLPGYPNLKPALVEQQAEKCLLQRHTLEHNLAVWNAQELSH